VNVQTENQLGAGNGLQGTVEQFLDQGVEARLCRPSTLTTDKGITF
jgi:hypothetical protein